MAARNLQKIEAEFFRSLNHFVEPIVRMGVGSPLPWSSGTVVLEVKGRKSGETFSLPIMATLVGDLILVGTVRTHSQWVKNLAATPEIRYWIYGRQREAKAFVFAANSDTPKTEGMPEGAACLAKAVLPYSRLFGASFAVLVPK